MSQAARQRAIDVLSWDRWGERMIKIIRDAAENPIEVPLHQ